MTDLKPWKTLNSTVVLDRRPWMRVFSEDVQLPDGRVVQGYLRLETPDYAVIVPVDRENRVGLIRSYKRGVDAVDVQPPAGLIEPGEDPLLAAQRELLEETGCRAEHWLPLGAYILGGNFCGGHAHIFLATGCLQVAEPDSGDLEEQEVLWWPVERVRQRWRRGDFRQLGSVAALGLALAHLEDGHA